MPQLAAQLAGVPISMPLGSTIVGREDEDERSFITLYEGVPFLGQDSSTMQTRGLTGVLPRTSISGGEVAGTLQGNPALGGVWTILMEVV